MPTALTRDAHVEVPIICGAMYPCTNPELVAAVASAGALGIVQPMSLETVHGHEFRAGLALIRAATPRPFGVNLIVEKSVKLYEERTRRWLDQSLEAGVRFFVTALGDPRWVVERVHAAGGVVYHDVTERKWADKAVQAGVDGLICVNRLAGGHAGTRTPEELFEALAPLGKPLVCAGGVGAPADFTRMLALGYAGVQMGTRFIATTECKVHDDYKQAILRATADDIVLTDKLSGVPCAIIKTPYVARMGTRAGPLARALLRHRRTKHLMRSFYALSSIWKLRKAALGGSAYKDYFQAGKSVAGIERVEPVAEVVRRFVEAAAVQRSA
jgi:nitronate monooxygenase